MRETNVHCKRRQKKLKDEKIYHASKKSSPNMENLDKECIIAKNTMCKVHTDKDNNTAEKLSFLKLKIKHTEEAANKSNNIRTKNEILYLGNKQGS